MPPQCSHTAGASGYPDNAAPAEPVSALEWARLGAYRLRIAQYDEGIEAYRTSLELDEFQPAVWNNLGVALCFRRQIRAAIECFERGIALTHSVPELYSNLLFTLNYDPEIEPQQAFERHQQWAAIYGGAEARFLNPQPRLSDRPIRVGYVSGSFYEHSLAYTFEPILAAHSRPAFHVTCYSNSSQVDAVTARLQRTSDCWREIYNLTDNDAAALIRADAIDILVDLNGHCGGSRLTLFSQKPAPVQVTWNGYPNTTGLRTIDYRFTCPLSDPPGQTEHIHTEELIRLPCFTCYLPPDWAPPCGPLPARSVGRVTLGCFNNIPKICDSAIEAWSRILVLVPGSRLVLKSRGYASERLRSRMREIFASAGVDANRVEMIEFTPRREDHLDLYNRVDLALDTWPYNGTVTTMEALWMGVPVISLVGCAHVARVGLSLLAAVGLNELAVSSADEYVATAVELARDLPYLESLRSGMRARMASSPLMDYSTRARDMESKFRWMLDRAYGRLN